MSPADEARATDRPHWEGETGQTRPRLGTHGMMMSVTELGYHQVPATHTTRECADLLLTRPQFNDLRFLIPNY